MCGDLFAPSWVGAWWPCTAETLGTLRFRETSSSPSTTFRSSESFTSSWPSVETWPQLTQRGAAQIREYKVFAVLFSWNILSNSDVAFVTVSSTLFNCLFICLTWSAVVGMCVKSLNITNSISYLRASLCIIFFFSFFAFEGMSKATWFLTKLILERGKHPSKRRRWIQLSTRSSE